MFYRSRRTKCSDKKVLTEREEEFGRRGEMTMSDDELTMTKGSTESYVHRGGRCNCTQVKHMRNRCRRPQGGWETGQRQEVKWETHKEQILQNKTAT